jgi:hypothetical protein
VNQTSDMRTRLSIRRRYRRVWLGPLPIVLGALGAIVLLGAWRLAADPNRHTQQKFDPQPRHFVDVEGAIAPLYLVGDGGADSLLILGDSRADCAISLTVLARHGIEHAGLLWNGFAQLNYQLRAARSMAPRRLLICLSPSALYVAPMKRMALLLEKERAVRLTKRIDERLSEQLDVFRLRMVRTLGPRDWAIGAVDSEPEPERLAGLYSKLMDHKLDAIRQEQFEELRRNLREMRDAGRRILCVRLPASSLVEGIEDEGFPPEQFREMCTELGFPYLDLSGRDPQTSDGVHLLGEDADAMTVVLADWLRAQPEMQGDLR